jgi:hypothetical protein
MRASAACATVRMSEGRSGSGRAGPGLETLDKGPERGAECVLADPPVDLLADRGVAAALDIDRRARALTRCLRSSRFDEDAIPDVSGDDAVRRAGGAQPSDPTFAVDRWLVLIGKLVERDPTLTSMGGATLRRAKLALTSSRRGRFKFTHCRQSA